MDAPRETPSPAAVMGEVANESAGLGIISFALFPLAMPLVLPFVFAPLVLLALPVLLLAAIAIVPFKLARAVVRRFSASGRRSRRGSPSSGLPRSHPAA